MLNAQCSHEPRPLRLGAVIRGHRASCIELRALSIESLPAPVRVDVNTRSALSTLWIGEGVDRAPARAARRPPYRPEARRSSRARRSGACTARQIQRVLGGAEPILIADGERYKNLQSVSRIYDALMRSGADRGSALVAIGGGVIGDTAGFAAATFLRGITLVQVPTTLLAQVDSSVGGKVGVNLPVGKNLVGAFHQPAVVVDRPAPAAHAAASRVPVRPVRGGQIRHDRQPRALRSRRARHEGIFAKDPAVLVPAIVESCRIKADVVTKDERESGLRRILNFGHTVGHAFEAVTRYRRFRHGEAIAYGMLAAADLAVARGALAERDRHALAQLIIQLGPLPPVADLVLSRRHGCDPA